MSEISQIFEMLIHSLTHKEPINVESPKTRIEKMCDV